MVHHRASQPIATHPLFLTNQAIRHDAAVAFPPLSLLVFICSKLSSLACLIHGIGHLSLDLHLRSLRLILEWQFPEKKVTQS